MGNHRADVFAACEHELDNHPSVFDQVCVKVDLLVVLGNQFHVGQVAPLNKLARRDVLEVVVVCARRGRFLCEQAGCPSQTGCSYGSGSCASSRQPFSPRNSCHNLCSFLFVHRLLQWRLVQGFWLVSPACCTCQSSIIAWSSCTVLWQCKG